MMLVDIFVPSIDNTYNFSLDENASIGSIVEEVLEMVERKEHATFVGERDTVSLIDLQTQRVLPKDQSLRACSVPTGHTLMLI